MEDDRLLDASEDDILVPETQDSPATFSQNLIKHFGICRNSMSTDAAHNINNNHNINNKDYITDGIMTANPQRAITTPKDIHGHQNHQSQSHRNIWQTQETKEYQANIEEQLQTPGQTR